MNDIQWINTDEAARRLGITTRTLYRFMDRGEIPSYRMGRVFRFRIDDLDAFIESCRVEPGSLRHLYSSGEEEDKSTKPAAKAEKPENTKAAKSKKRSRKSGSSKKKS